MKQPVVGVSACLLGHSVRYDGKHKYTELIAEELSHYCQLIAICPEVQIGLGVPRAKIRLTRVGTKSKVLQINQPGVDVSEDLIECAKQFVNQNTLSGLVLQDKSPSCGIKNTALFSEEGQLLGNGTGLFAETILNLYPELVVIPASQLHGKNDIETFIHTLFERVGYEQ